MSDFARKTTPGAYKRLEHRGKYMNTPTADLLLEIRGWFKVMGYNTSEEVDAKRAYFIGKINETLGLES